MKNKKIKIKDLFLDKRYILLFALILFSIVILYKTIKFSDVNNKKIKVTVLQQDRDIKNLHDKTNTTFARDFYVDEINFPVSSSVFKHKHLRVLQLYEFKNNFIVVVETFLRVNKEGVYEFDVYSDDGFSLTIGDAVIMEFPYARDMDRSIANVILPVPGNYYLKIEYFQGLGLMGLKAMYKRMNDDHFYMVGEDSPYITYSPSAQ